MSIGNGELVSLEKIYLGQSAIYEEFICLLIRKDGTDIGEKRKKEKTTEVNAHLDLDQFSLSGNSVIL